MKTRLGDDTPEVLYSRVVADVRNSGLSLSEVAKVIRVNVRQVQNWIAGTNTPRGPNRDRLLQLHYITVLLRDAYTREGAEIWLHHRSLRLNGRRPLDMLAAGQFDEVLAAVERLT